MRLPVSTLLKEQPGCGVLIRVVWQSLLPNSPEDAEPYAGKDADGIRVFAAPLPDLAVDARRPWVGAHGLA